MRQKGVPARLEQDGSNKPGQVEGAQGDSQASWFEAPEMVAMTTEAASSHASTDGEDSSRPDTMGDVGSYPVQFVCEYCQSLHESPSLLQEHVEKTHTAVVPTDAFRRERNRIRMQEKRKNLTEEEKAKIREKQKLQARQRRMCMSEEKKAQAREKDRLTKQMRRSASNDDLEVREKNRVQKLMYRQNATEEQRALWRERDKLRKREDREVKAVRYRLFDKLYSGIEAMLVGLPPDSDQNCTSDQGPVQDTVQASTEEPTFKTGTISDTFNSVQNLLTFMLGAHVVTDAEITRIHEIILKTMNSSVGDLSNDVRVYQKALEDCTAGGDVQETTDTASSSPCTQSEHQPGPSSLGDTSHAGVMDKSEELEVKNSHNTSPLEISSDVDTNRDVTVKQEVVDCAEVMEKSKHLEMKNSDNASSLENSSDVHSSSNVSVKQEVIDCADNIRDSAENKHVSDRPNVLHSSVCTNAQQHSRTLNVDTSSSVLVKQEVVDCADNIRDSAENQHVSDRPNVLHSSVHANAQQHSRTLSEEVAALVEVIQKARWLIALAEGQDCPEIHLAIRRERVKIRNMLRMLIAPTQDMEKEREIAKLRMALKRQTASPAEKELEKEKGRLRMRWKRMTQTEEEREREKERNRIRTRLKRMEMSAEERERIKDRERLRKRQKREMATEEQKQAWRESDRISKRIKRGSGTSQQQSDNLWMGECSENVTHGLGYQQAYDEHRDYSSDSQMSNMSRGNLTSDDGSIESVQQSFSQKGDEQIGCSTSEEDSNKELEDVTQGTASQSEGVTSACASHETVAPRHNPSLDPRLLSSLKEGQRSPAIPPTRVLSSRLEPRTDHV
ncbi:general transcriptional corepressor trfA-like isoform X4 [Branchiostoma floridae]|uniref:General transcriptional corepressor trfA-like isoform X4 n=1 Tax=Branchiostoma floridae TaxID=7739 RepID=A0A9J7M984_BRAFL|nr:general transcriptional corepressor trfA-like isoform X4 [Branchiostoma floridae]